MGFLIAAIIIVVSCSAITIKTLVGYNHLHLALKALIGIMVVLGWMAPVWINLLRRNDWLNSGAYNSLHHIGYFLFGFGFILFSVLLLRDLFWFAGFQIGKFSGLDPSAFDPKNSQLLNKANLYAVALSLVLSFWAVYEAIKIPMIKTITYTSSKIDREYKIVLLNDLHLTRASSLQRLQRVVNLINNLHPDAILMAGDIIDDRVDVLEPDFNILESLHAPLGIYASTGNHELYNGLDMWRRRFRKMGIKVLINQGEKIPQTNLYIGGVPDHNTSLRPFYQINLEKVFKGSQPDQYKLLLSHNPDLSAFDYNKYDLQLSGHTHGGQIFPFHFLAAKGNKYLAGSYHLSPVELYVSRGAGYWGPAMRLFAPAEITQIILQPKK